MGAHAPQIHDAVPAAGAVAVRAYVDADHERWDAFVERCPQATLA
jgi:hypothetical protein